MRAFEAAKKSGAPNLANSHRNFPQIDFLNRGSSFHPLYVYPVEPKEEYKRYNVIIRARNGAFTGFVRIKRLQEGGWTSALLVHASFGTKSGIVLQKIHRQFPKELLKTDQDWSAFKKKAKVIEIAE
jgi:hypothetical protein